MSVYRVFWGKGNRKLAVTLFYLSFCRWFGLLLVCNRMVGHRFTTVGMEFGTMVVDIDHNFSRIARRAASDFEKFVVMLEEIM